LHSRVAAIFPDESNRRHATIRRGLSLTSFETTPSSPASGPSQPYRIFVVEGTSDIQLRDFYCEDAAALASLAGRLLYVVGNFQL
jgi:hypothetical protein